MTQQEIENRITEYEFRIKAIETDQSVLKELVKSVTVLGEQTKGLRTDVNSLLKDMKDIQGKSGKMWEKVIEYIILALVGAVLGFVISRIGL